MENKRHHRKIVRNLTPEQKAKRKERLKKIGKAFLWLNPASATVMSALLVRDKVKKNRANKAAKSKPTHPESEAVIDGLQKIVAAEVAKNAGASKEQVQEIIAAKPESVGGANPIDQVVKAIPSPEAITLEKVAEKAAEPSEHFDGDDGELLGWAYAEGGIPDKVKEAIETAKAKAYTLQDPAKADALAQIKEIEQSLNDAYSTAKSVAQKADKMDVAEISSAVKSADVKSVAASVAPSAVAPEKVEEKPKDEKAALGEQAEGGIPKWVKYGSGILLLSGAAYFLFLRKKKDSK